MVRETQQVVSEIDRFVHRNRLNCLLRTVFDRDLFCHAVDSTLLQALPPALFVSLGIDGRKLPKILNQKQGLETGSFLI